MLSNLSDGQVLGLTFFVAPTAIVGAGAWVQGMWRNRRMRLDPTYGAR